MAWYYGVNNSDLYGSNFSTVLADAPPPLDDTFDEDDNEIVFRNDVNKSKKYGEKPVASLVKKTQSSEEKFTEKSKLGGSVQKGKNEHDTEEGDEESDFGDFASFADFGSAFGQGNGSGESQDWFTSHDNSEKSLQSWDAKSSQQGPSNNVENGVDDSDFAAFQANEDSVNIQESLPNGSSHQGNSDSDWVNKSALTNSNINGSYDLESDDDFGDFATTENATTNPGVTAVKDVDNGETADKKSVAHHGDSTVDVNTKALFHDDSKKDCDILKESLSEQNNEFKTEKDTAPDVSSERFLGFVGSNRGDQESRQLDSLSAEATSSEIPTTVLADSEEGVHINSVSSRSTRIKQSTNGEQLTGKKCNTVDSQNYTTLEKDAAKLSPEPSESICNGDDFGEFADFNDMPLQQSSGRDELVQKDISPVAPEGENDEVVKGDSSFVGTASKRNKYYSDDDDDDFGDFGSFEKKHGKQDETSSDSITVDAKLTESKVNNDPFVAKASSIQDKDIDNDFGDFGAFEVNHSEKEERTGSVDSEPKPMSNQEKDKDDFGGFGAFDSFSSGTREDKDQNNSIGSCSASDLEEKPLQIEGQNSDDFGDFDSFRSSAMNSQKGCDGSSANTETFGSFESNIKDSHKDNERSKDFGDFGTFESSVENSLNNGQCNDDFGGFDGNESDTKSVQEKDENTDDFGDFGSFEANSKDCESQNKNTDDFNEDFGSFETNAKDSERHNENGDDFGDFGSFESNAKDFGQDAQSGFGDFGAFKSQDSIKADGGDDDFGGFETADERVSEQKFEGFKASSTKGELKQNIQTNEFGAFDSKSKNLSTAKQTDDDFGDFSHGEENKSGGFASFSSSDSNLTASLGASTDKNTSIKQQKTEILQHFSPSVNFMIKQARDSISVCFTSELKNKFNSQCTILSSRVGKSLHSNKELWQHLEHAENEGQILFSWSNSFSQHKKFLSLCICPERPPPLQVGSMLKPIVSSQFPPFGGGQPGALLMPAPVSKMPQFTSGLDFLEPLKGSQAAVQSPLQSKESMQGSSHPMALPDLSFIMGNSLKRTSSKPDVKDNISDTTSESSSLDLDFFAPSISQPQGGKTESRGLYEEDLLGLNISLSSVDQQKLDSPKPQKTSDTKKVWQRGGVTIPLSSQEKQAQLSAAAKNILDQLEDLAFMNSPVLMFPLKPE